MIRIFTDELKETMRTHKRPKVTPSVMNRLQNIGAIERLNVRDFLITLKAKRILSESERGG